MLPTVLMNASKKFVVSPQWRMSDGKDLVRVELTVHKVLLTNNTRRGLKAGGSLHSLVVSGLASPLLLLDRQEDRCQFADHRPARRRRRHSKTTHHPWSHAEDSNHPAIADHHQTTTSNIYFSCQPAEEEVKDAVTISASQQEEEPYPLRQLRLLIPYTWEVWPPGSLQRPNDEFRRRNRQGPASSTPRWDDQHRSSAYFMYKFNVSDKKWVMLNPL